MPQTTKKQILNIYMHFSGVNVCWNRIRYHTYVWLKKYNRYYTTSYDRTLYRQLVYETRAHKTWMMMMRVQWF